MQLQNHIPNLLVLPTMASEKEQNNAPLSDKNLLLFAMRNYTNTQCNGVEEFNEDFAIPIHLKKLFTRYAVNDVLKDRLIINHIISFLNVFEPEAALRILFFKLDTHHHVFLKTFLVFLHRCPDFIMLDGKILNLSALPVDPVLLAKLNEGLSKCQ
jgi:hypothetical protein